MVRRGKLVGPFSVRDGEDNYQLYLIRPASSSQSHFINLLFDRPLLLLIVTMLVSTPLPSWLAWSLAKPARKLKNAADEVAQVVGAHTLNWKRGHRNSLPQVPVLTRWSPRWSV